MLVLVDSNVLLRVIEPRHSQHDSAVQTLRSLRAGGHELCVAPQIHYEFWVVATRPVALNGLGMTADEADSALLQFSPPLFRLLRDERVIYDRWRELVSKHQVMGKQAHDARLVAAMQRHGLAGFLTFNVDDFLRYSGIKLLEPGKFDSNLDG